MDRKVPAPVVDERLAQAILGRKVETAIGLLRQTENSYLTEYSGEIKLDGDRTPAHTAVLDQATQLDVDTKVALIRRLMTHLENEQIQAVLEFGQRQIAERQRQSSVASAERQTRLLLKKDYSYQSRGLSQPNQYYVYLRRRKPKLDRYIGTLFYIPQGCTLSYVPDAEGRIIFDSPHNVFLLQDFQNAAVTKVVRLIGLEPPPVDYTFTKQQNDNPEIYLRVEYLDAQTYRPLREESYPFPFCMYEGGQLDRYRWDVSTLILPVERSAVEEQAQTLDTLAAEANSFQPLELDPEEIELPVPPLEEHPDLHESGKNAAKPARRIIELPAIRSSTFYLSNRCDAGLILERMRLWVVWSEKAMPQSRWELIQEGETYTLRNASFNRNILRFSLDRASVTLENSLPVLMRWFHDLGLAISQSQSQKQFSPAQLKLAHSLFVDMSLPPDNALVVLKKLFGAEFSKTSLYQ